MFKKLLVLIIFFAFSFNAFIEGNEFNLKETQSNYHYLTSSAPIDLYILTGIDFEDCKTSDCHSEEKHCIHHCLNHLMAMEFGTKIKLNALRLEINKTNWYYDQHYRAPFIDPALKPPLFS